MPFIARSPRHATAAPVAVLAVLVGLLLTGCAPPVQFSVQDPRLKVIATTGIIADIAQNVAGQRAVVTSLVPPGASVHSYEPTLRDVRSIAYADLALSNGLLLEEHRIIKALAANLRPGAGNVTLGEEADKRGGKVIPLIENLTLDTVWLGIRARGSGAALGTTAGSDVELRAAAVEGPGRLVAYTTETLGARRMFIDSDRIGADSAVLPPNAHSHMSWAFTAPGVYRLTLAAAVRKEAGATPVPVGESTYTFAVGVPPETAARTLSRAHAQVDPNAVTVLDGGHADVSVDLDAGHLDLYGDVHGQQGERMSYDPESTVIEVPNKAIQEIPSGPGYRFLGSPGDRLYQLPQAVLGKHVHGELDPHLWQNVKNAKAYALTIRDALVLRDPDGKAIYDANTARYAAELDALDAEIAASMGAIPRERRQLITTHDAFAYFADAYGLTVAGFVTPSPVVQPSVQDRRKLTETIRNLAVPAVFLEPNLLTRTSALTSIARDAGVAVCPIYGDTFDSTVTTYAAMMRATADSVSRCLNPESTTYEKH